MKIESCLYLIMYDRIKRALRKNTSFVVVLGSSPGDTNYYVDTFTSLNKTVQTGHALNVIHSL